ncbi:MAG: reverse transcriptase/maturase family protein [Lachnospiraceae bacterium]|nr:reverse transcriptase/maturase family protein [Lachnospiraceae bacterium]
MSLLDMLSREESWEKYYRYKTGLAVPKDFVKELRAFIDSHGYLKVCDGIECGERFALPKKAIISKQGSAKKRVVYSYPYAENMVLKLLTHLILRKYDGIYSDNLYSFRPGRSAKDAIRRITLRPLKDRMYFYKVDVKNYFNSIPVDRLIPMIEDTLKDDTELFDLLRRLLEEKYVLDEEEPVIEEKGIMAGTPIASFYADLYLKELDRYFADEGAVYARYSDDIIVFAQTEEKRDEYAGYIRRFLGDMGLDVNPDKEFCGNASEGFSFLGFEIKGSIIDIAPASVVKMKQKMRRKMRALDRWRKRGGFNRERAAAAFIRIFNSKLLENAGDNDLTWSYWFFSVINTEKSLHMIDLYAQQCIRYLLAGTHSKARYNVRYSRLKELGYKSLVHAYYDFRIE